MNKRLYKLIFIINTDQLFSSRQQSIGIRTGHSIYIVILNYYGSCK